MPLQTFHLIRLQPTVSASFFLASLRSLFSGPSVILASRPRFLVVSPTHTDTAALASKPWDLLLLLQPSPPQSTASIPKSLSSLVVDAYALDVGVPSRIMRDYPERNARLRREAVSTPLTGALETARRQPSAQNLELSAGLLRCMEDLERVYEGPVTQLNLLRFREGGGREQYAKYGKGFVEVAGKIGGDAKIVGSVVRKQEEEKGWDEISLVHYASIRHFCDMAASADYQEINQKYRLGALDDTILMCTTELDLENGITSNSKL
ncbi:MAG: hypothetical protein M1821_000130 [Bathelium mastoideum]|nr:MAG: hypothetical protein M1821_000130 [Bathelium mastoideum]